MNNTQQPLDINQIISHLDYLLSKNDYAAACNFLEENVGLAEDYSYFKVLFTLCNECIGIYRKTGNKEQCFKYCQKALSLTQQLDFNSTIAGATTFINCGTAYKAFGEAQKSIPFFENALQLYEKLLPPNDRRLAGLYNNFSLSLVDLKEYDKALTLYEKAIEVLNHNPNFNLEQAVTYINMANLFEAQKGLENACGDIDILLDKAEAVLDKNHSTTDGNYAFVCEKCAPTFGYYGRFLYEQQLKERARVIYERT